MSRTRFLTALGLVAAIVALSLAAWQITYAVSLSGLQTRLGDELGLVHRAVRSEIERFRTLPRVVAEDQRVIDLLDARDGKNVRAVNLYLRAVREKTGAAELFLLDAEGMTLAASNWDKPLSFVGQNYSFRPYFKDAMAQGEGRFYAVGVTTGIPGYFMSWRILTKTGRLGVVVVKVDLSPLQQAWRKAASLTAIADGDGVVFLAGPKSWAYRPLHALSPTALTDMADDRKYDGIGLDSARPLLPQGANISTPKGQVVDGLLFRADGLQPDGWSIVGARAISPVRTFAGIVAALTALTGMLLSSLYLYSRQRRQLIKIRLEQNRVLEERVGARTRELAHEVEVRRRAEQDLRAAQGELVQAAKLAALGQMSAAIVHEISQPLAAMETTLAAALAHGAKGAHKRVDEKLVGARNLTRRIRRTIKHLRSFARKDEGRAGPLDVGECIERALELAAPRAKALGAQVTFKNRDGKANVIANGVRLEQVVLNLVLNGLDAVEDAADPMVEIALKVAKGEARIEVGDNGAGIPQELSGRITEPFFTTKSASEGMGLGLSISQTIVDDYGGTLSFSLNEGGGTMAVVALPLCGYAAQSGQNRAAPNGAEHGEAAQ